MTGDRDKWRKYVHGVANRRIDDAAREQNRTLLFRYWFSTVDYTDCQRVSQPVSAHEMSLRIVCYI